jgi:glycerol-3-phosphate cytidylyltransferase
MSEERVGYAAGAFDLFHIGHLNILKNARDHCDRLIAGVVSDEKLERTKGRLPVIPLEERLQLIRSVRYVDEAVTEDVSDKMQMWQQLHFTIFFKGDDWRGTRKGLALEREFATVGVEVIYFPYTVATSSTMLRRALDALVATPVGIPADIFPREA